VKAEGRAHRLQVAQSGLFPLSNSQTEIWLGQKLSPDSPCYNIGRCVEIFGTIDPNLFEVALRQTIHDVDSLRLRFVETAFGPRQFFSPTADESLQFYDLSETDNPRAAAETWMRQDLARVFAMASGALFRSALFKVADGHFLWYGVNHHLINDAFGASLIERIVADHYSALAQVGRRKPARAPSWLEMLDEEESYRRSDRYDRDRIFWRGRLEDRPEPSTLSGRPPNWTGQTIRTGGCVAGSIIDALKAAVGGRHISLAAILAAATAAYLTRTTGMGDVILGMPVTARPSPTLRRIVGLASNVVPFRLQVDLAASFQDLLEQAGRELRQALRHQRYWTGAMRKDLGLTPDQPDFYGTIINFIPIDEELDFAGAPVRKHNLFNLRVGDLSITVLAGSKTRDIAVELTANETHYDAATLSGHLRGFLRLIEALAAAPGLPIGHLAMPASEDRARVMGFASPLFAPTRTTLPALFEAQVSRTPDGVAAIQGGRSLC
jgi:nonribosomal peptide synthetase DhbF